MSRYQKGKTNLDFTWSKRHEWQWHELGHMQVCTSLQTDNHASTSLLSFLQAVCPSCRPTNSIKALNCRVKMLDFRCCGLLWICCTSLGRIPRVTVRAGFKCVEALGGIIIRVQTGGVLCVVVCLEQGADNSMIYIYKLYDLHAIFYSRLPVSKSIFMFP